MLLSFTFFSEFTEDDKFNIYSEICKKLPQMNGFPLFRQMSQLLEFKQKYMPPNFKNTGLRFGEFYFSPYEEASIA